MAKRKVKGARQQRRANAPVNKKKVDEKFMSPENLLMAAARAFERGDTQSTLTICKDLLDKDENNHAALNLVGCAYGQYNQNEKALAFFQKAIQLDPKGAGYFLNAGRSLLFLGKYENAAAYIEKSIELQPHFEGYFYLGRVNLETLKLEEAERLFRLALEMNPLHANSLESLAAVLEQTNRTEEAEELIEQIKNLKTGSTSHLLIESKLLRRRGEFSEAKKTLEKYISESDSKKDKSLGLSEMAKVLDKEGNFDEAFKNYTVAQQNAADFYSTSGTSNQFITMLNSYHEWFGDGNMDDWSKSKSEHSESPAPVFLVGFSRSGTTLMEQILSSHPNIFTTQEAGLIESLLFGMGDIIGYAPQYPHVLNDLTDSNIKDLRADYWKRFEATFGKEAKGKCIVDKMPFNITLLGFINRIFPDAKIITMIRDPRDTILSTFMQSFVHNSTMSNFYNLENTAEVYSKVMNLYEKYKNTLQLDLVEIKYEELVDDIENNSKKVLEFIDQKWDSSVLEFYNEKNKRSIATPNEGVVQPIYSSSKQRWKNYEKQISKFDDLLKPHITKYNYQN